MLGLHKLCHISKILNCLKIHNFEDLYICSKLSFLNSIKSNELSQSIFNYICSEKANKKNNSKSFIQDIRLLEKNFNLEISAIFREPLNIKRKLLKKFHIKNGIYDSINTCLTNFKNKSFKLLLNNLIKPDFIKLDEEFPELLQYLIITDEYS